jgi:hypothetical protein
MAEALPAALEITTIPMAELHQGSRWRKAPPSGGATAARYGPVVALTLEANRDPRPRRMDLMIAAIASSRDLPLYTRNADDFRGLGDMIEVIAV